MFRERGWLSSRGAVVDRKLVPKLPNTKKGLFDLLELKFKEIKVTDSEIAPAGGISYFSILLECPFCHSTFIAEHSEGCFHSTITPDECPVCDFKRNVINKYMELRKGK